MFINRNSHKPFQGEKMTSGRSKVQRAGFMSTNLRIKAILNAGKQLKDWREEQFDFKTEKEIEDHYFNPLARKDITKMDVADLARNVRENLETSYQNAQNQRRDVSQKETGKSTEKQEKPSEGLKTTSETMSE